MYIICDVDILVGQGKRIYIYMVECGHGYEGLFHILAGYYLNENTIIDMYTLSYL